MQIPDKDKEFYQLLGFAITQWHFIEMGLFVNYWRFSQTPQFEVASATFHSVRSAGAKIDMAEHSGAMALAKFPEIQKDWDCLIRRCNKQNGIRNHVAHFAPVYDEKRSSDSDIAIASQVYLSPSPVNINAIKRWGDQAPKYDKQRLRQIGDAFRALAFDLLEFAEKSPLKAQTQGWPPGQQS